MAKRETGDGARTISLLARAIATVTSESLSPAAIRQAQLLLLDTIGCGLAGAHEMWHGRDLARGLASSASHDTADDCAIIGRNGRADVLDAVLLNGASIRVLDLNDYIIAEANGEPESAGHPSDNIPVALAMGSARGQSGREILAAIVIGYELYARLRRSMDRARHWDGVTASGLVAPAIAGRLMGLDEIKLRHALALGAARAPTPSIVRTGNISAAKSIANALVAHSGVQAALLAEQGITGPLAILDDERGLRDVFPRMDPSILCAPFSFDGAIMRAHVKAYPCINTGQSAVAAALKLHAMVNGKLSSLSQIEVTMADYKVTKRHQEDPERRRPVSREAADHSYPFIVAVALADGHFGTEQFERERWQDATVTALMERIVMRRDAAWNSRAPGSYPCSIRATDAQGTEHRVEVAYPPGYSRSGLDANIVLDKFHGVTESILSRADRVRIVDTVMEFDQCPSAEPLNAAIAIEGKSK